jgi:hypothetical protein
MNTTLSRTRQLHPPQPEVQVEPRPVARVSLLDRAALHVGLALITWSRRTRPTTESRERRAHLYEQHLARLERERVAERMRLVTMPQRWV